jgi:hypothetical protein
MSAQRRGVRTGRVPYGLGVFATRNFVAGQVVAEVDGRLIRDANYSSDTCVDLGGPYVLEPDKPFRFLNHSCEPNCRFLLVERDRSVVPTVFLETTRPVRRGEQLTIDYAWPAEDAIRCLCGSPRCRGWVVAADLLGTLPDLTPSEVSSGDSTDACRLAARGNAKRQAGLADRPTIES